METASILKKLRLRLGLTQQEFAELVGTQQPQVARSERPGHVSDLTYMTKVAKATGKQLKVEYAK